MKNTTIGSFVVCLTLAGAVLAGSIPATVAAAPHQGYSILNKIAISGHGGWDYLTLDGAARRLYVSRSTRVMVFDADIGASVGEIPDTPEVTDKFNRSIQS